MHRDGILELGRVQFCHLCGFEGVISSGIRKHMNKNPKNPGIKLVKLLCMCVLVYRCSPNVQRCFQCFQIYHSIADKTMIFLSSYYCDFMLRARASRKSSPKTGMLEGSSYSLSDTHLLFGDARRRGHSQRRCPRECPTRVPGAFGTLLGHSRAQGPKGPEDTPWDSPRHPCFRGHTRRQGHASGHSGPKHLRDT